VNRSVNRAVVITGAGVLSSVADTPEGLHAALCEGRSGLREIELFPLDGLGARRAGEIRPFEPRDYLGERNLRPIRPAAPGGRPAGARIQRLDPRTAGGP
jgi:3-oxoacyl-(acyl-carrier-protein) synthase